MKADKLARELGFKRSGNKWVGPCVAHPGRNPSMIIFVGRNGLTQVRCLAGICDPIDIIEVLCERGLCRSAGDLWCGNEMPWDEEDARCDHLTGARRPHDR